MKQISAIDEYMAKVYKWIISIVMIAVSAGAVNFTGMKLLGFYPMLSWGKLVAFLISNVIYDSAGIWLIRHAVEGGALKPKFFAYGKIYMTMLLIVQFNFILYLVPSREFWVFVFYFVLLDAFFLDHKLVLLHMILLTLSLVVGAIIKPDILLPVRDELFVPELAIRLFIIFLTYMGIYLLTKFVGKYLADAKRDELEKNNTITNQILNKAASISERLAKTSSMVLENVESESASTEELSSISEELLEMSRNIITHNSESTNNLHLLKECSVNVSSKVKKSTEISDELVDISSDNEKDLNNLLSVSDEVVSSNENTMQAIERLLKGTKKIGSTLNIINEIATSTNLLALNASIEAARAGEAGRGFAVVANEIGNLARNTQSSLKEINEVVKTLEAEASVVSDSIVLSSDKLSYQNETLANTVEKVKGMMKLLVSSLDAIREVDALNEEQVSLISTTFSFNENISRQIEVENEQFTNIVGVVQSNTQEITELNNQVDGLNEIVKELEELLRR